MIDQKRINRLEATAKARGNSELGRELRRILEERALFRDLVATARRLLNDDDGREQRARLSAALSAVEDFE